MKSLLITGASGYVGRNLVSKVSKLNKYDISVLLRKRDNATLKEIRQIIINDFTKIENSFSKLGTPDLIVHLAGIAHKKNIKNDDFISINVDVTSKLYNWAVEVNAEKFIFLSSIGVNGQVSVSPLDEMSNPNPQEFYAESKLRAENAITLNKDNNYKTKYVIIRSPLIYGLNAPGNFKLLKKWINSPLPLPFGKVNNKRSIISINNLTDFIIHTFSHPSASNETFLVSDLEPLSTKELVNAMIGSNNSYFKNFVVPVFILKLILFLIGKRSFIDKLFGTLEINITKSKSILGWKPPYSSRSEIEKAMSIKNDK